MTETTHSGKPPIAAGAAFLLLAAAARWRTPLPVDARFARFVQDWQGVIPADSSKFGNWLGLAPVIGAVALVIAAAFAARKWWFEAAVVVAAFCAKALNGPMKAVVSAPRPAAGAVRVLEHAAGSGFPSGHVMGVTLVLGAAAAMVERRAPRFRWTGWSIAAALILATAFGRIWVGAHWPSQTLGGALAGVVLLAVLDSFLHWFEVMRRSR